MIDIYNRYKVELMYGGESPNETIWTYSLEEARILVDRAEHSIVTFKNKTIEL